MGGGGNRKVKPPLYPFFVVNDLSQAAAVYLEMVS